MSLLAWIALSATGCFVWGFASYVTSRNRYADDGAVAWMAFGIAVIFVCFVLGGMTGQLKGLSRL